MNDLEIIKQIEKVLNVKLEKTHQFIWKSRNYILNQNNQVISIGLFDCEIDNRKLLYISFLLKDLNNLKQLELSNNQINDIFPLIDFDNLSELYLSKNQISDIS
ncbi:MAG: hypothetical protein A2033_17200 [Bacteroidetes bacterium GWA2_31_9]|nr:MAG: hypothetical protein A2033_17200 [Bacteroidetes bacterium GWA2_31_9]